MVSKFKKNLNYNLLLVFTFIRMLWLTLKEPTGARIAGQMNTDPSKLGGIAAIILPFVVYPSIVILAGIIVGLLLKKNWAYTASFIFASIHLVLVVSLMILGVSPGYGPIIVITSCIGMIVFSKLTQKSILKNQKEIYNGNVKPKVD